MKIKVTLAILAVAVLAISCVRKDDFSDLKYPITIQGEFDPDYGLPLAYYVSDMWDLVGLFAYDTSDNLHVRLDSNSESGLLTLYAQYTDTLPPIIFGNDKGRKNNTMAKASGDTTMLYQTTLHHENPIKLGQYLIDNDITLHNLYISFDATIQAEISEITQRLIDHGVIIYFDTVDMVIDCKDGTQLVQQIDLGEKVPIQELVNGKSIRLVDNYDIKELINHNANHASFTTTLNVAATEETDFIGLGSEYLNDTLLVKRLNVVCNAYVEYSAILFVGNLIERDTIDADCSSLNDYVYDSYSDDTISVSVSEQDTDNYIILKAENRLPCNVVVQLRGLDANKMPVTDGLISGTHTIQSPEIERVPSEIAYTTTDHDAAHAYVGYQTVGVAKSELRIPVTADKIRQLANARYIEVSLHVTSTTKGADGTRPFVIVRNTDRLKLKMFVVAGAHMRINYPLDINRNK